MKRYVLFLLLVAATATPHYGYAWGKKGHQMVAELGFSMLDANTQKTIQKYLGNITVADAGTWMDDMRNNPDYAYLKPWHFTNIEKGDDYKPAKKGDVVSALNNAIDALGNRGHLTDAEIQLHILTLFHLTGDIAQPLHVGYGSDMGGNSVDVTYVSKPSNLHKVWDSEIIEGEHITLKDCQDVYKAMTDEQADAIRKVTDPEAWMEHSRKLLPRVYNYSDEKIDAAYISKNKIVIKRQIVYAGIRLAATLEALFGTPVKKTLVAVKPVRGLDTVTLRHQRYTSHFVNSAHIPWVVEYTLRKKDVQCAHPLVRTDNFAPDPFDNDATNLDDDYKGQGYDRGHNMPAADNSCNTQAMNECFYFSNMFPQTGRLNRGVWKQLEEQERDMAIHSDSIYVWIGNYGISKKIGPHKVVVPKYCWKVIYDFKTEEWSAYIFPNTTTVKGKPEDFVTTVDDIRAKSGFDFQ